MKTNLRLATCTSMAVCAVVLLTAGCRPEMSVSTSTETSTVASVSHVSAISSDDFEAQVLESDQPVLVDFWAEWCGPCRALAPIVNDYAGENEGKLVVKKLDVDENQSLAAEYQIEALPTLLLFKDGQEVHRIVGSVPKDELENELAPHIGDDS